MKRKDFFLAISSGVLLALTVYAIHWKILSWVALVPLLWAVHRSSFWRAFGLGCVTAVIYFSVYFSWIPYYSLVIFLFALACVLFFVGMWAGITAFLSRRFRNNLLLSFIPAVIWLGVEYLYSLTSFGSAAFHLETIQSQPLIQFIRYFGDSPTTFLILLANGLLAYSLSKRNKPCVFSLVVLVLFLAAGSIHGSLLLKPPVEGTIQVACVQPNFPIEERWRFEHADEVFETYRRMALEARDKGTQIIVFPQFMLPVDVYREPARISAMARESKAYLVLGTYTVDPQVKGKYNIALVFSPEGKIIGEYRAVRPPPFRRIGQIRGKEYTVIKTPLARLGILLCYDDVESKVARTLVQNGAQILVSMMNNGHFKKSKQLYLHFTRDILRAIETHRFVIRSATTGISAVIDPEGRVLSRSRIEERQIITARVAPLDGQTFFVKYGNLFTSFIAAMAFILLVSAIRLPVIDDPEK